MKVLKGYVRYRFHPKRCIAESYVGEEAVEFCSEFVQHCNPIGVSKDPSTLLGLLSSAKLKSIDEKDRDQAHLHVLSNNVEVDPYKITHKKIVEQLYAGKQKSKQWLISEHNRTFSDWFQAKVSTQMKENPTEVSQTMRWFAGKPSFTVFSYEGYRYNGVKYFTKHRDDARAIQNSDVTLVAKTMHVSSAKDKNPVESDMALYGIIEEIWEVDYHEFKAPLFLCLWAENEKGIKQDEFGFTLVNLNRHGHKKDKFASAGQVKQVFYVEDLIDADWSVLLTTPNRDYRDYFYEDDLGDTSMEHQPFCAEIPLPCDEDENQDDATYTRPNVEGFWVDQFTTPREQ